MDMHFISGLPRAGSTLLASILRQNPDFTASIMTPVGRIVTEALQAMGPSNEADGFLTDEKRELVLRGIMLGYYTLDGQYKTVFDNNRRWCANMPLIARLFPDARVIACVRDPRSIVDSFERLFTAHPLAMSVVYGSTANLSVYARVGEIMKPGGVLGFSLEAFATAYYGAHKERLHLISYDNLAQFPGRVMEELHDALRLPAFAYNFNKIEPIPGAVEFDRAVSTPGLHDLKPSVVYEPRQTVLPPDIVRSLPRPFWESKEAVTVAR